jgi:hypothetical protein
MSAGTLITTKDNIIIKRVPVWPWPAPGIYPRQNADGTITQFFPQPYYHFPIRGVLNNARLP